LPASITSTNDRKLPRLSLSGWILIGLFLGVGCGLFFGEAMSFLQVVADGFIRLLQMAVLPFITVALIAGLGRLNRAEMGVVVRIGGAVLVIFWVMALALVLAMPLAFPRWESASFFSAGLLVPPEELDFVQLFIPANPFHALTHGVVPAVVLFSIALGVALTTIPRRDVLIENLTVLSDALTRVTRFVVSLTPIGVFAITATAVGTMSFADLRRLEVYLATYVAVSLLVTFWIVPGLVAALTPLRYRDVVSASRDVILTALSTGSVLIVLPIISDRCEALLEREQLASGDSRSILNVFIPISFNFPHVGKLITLSFVVFAAWFAGSSLELHDYPRLTLIGLLTFFGSVNAALPFLLDQFDIPADLFQLFVAVGFINFRFSSMMGAMHTMAIALLGTCGVGGRIDARWGALLRYLVITVVLTAVCLGGLRLALPHLVDTSYQKDQLLTQRRLLLEPQQATVYRELTAVPPVAVESGTRLDGIAARGRIRVGYLRDTVPFAYFNAAGELVGLDIDLAHGLARGIGVGLEFVPLNRDRLAEQLDADLYDVAISQLAITPQRSRQVALTRPYLHVSVAFIVKDRRRREFATRESLRALGPQRIAFPARIPYIGAILRDFIPEAELIHIDRIDQFFEPGDREFDALMFSAEAGSAWNLLHPEYTVVVPQPDPIQVPLAFAAARGDEEFVSFLNAWIELKKSDTTIDRLYRYWVLGEDEIRREPRWSVIRNVLHWVE
jgi:Na+/H+-dicarboxylate symporter/ABC-type amino acid transport substrate-binding protein